MIQTIQNNIQHFFGTGHERSLRAKKNIVQSLFLKGGSIAVSLVLIPITIAYVKPVQYGIWLTLSSVVSWMAFFDIGLGNGLKNKLAVTIANRDFEKARGYISTTYALLLAISVVLFTVFCMVNPYINWKNILNVNAAININALALIMCGFFCLQFVAQLLNTVLTANQQPALCALLNVTGQFAVLLAIWILTKLGNGSLTGLLIVTAGIPLLTLIIAGFWFYNNSYSIMAPAISAVNLGYAKEMLTSGSTFLLIQLGALVLYETDNIVITQLFGPAQVTTFNVAYKLFSVILMVFTIAITPFWSAFTEAYTKNDYTWIRHSLYKINKLWLVLSIAAVVLLFISPKLYRLWLGDSISVPTAVSVAMCLYTIVSIWQTIHVYLLNGVGKVKLQLFLVVGSAILNIPLAIFLGKAIGLAGVTLSNAILFLIMGVVFSIQANKIVNKTAKGIFNE